tara:strand:+ start:261 stop:581 length:321 start_codon:yes stop_codon:yes gene_type:complete
MIDRRDPNSCFIEIVPKCEESYWTGEVEVNIIASARNKMDEESKASLIHLAQLVASTVALMERDPDLTLRLEHFIAEAEGDAKDKIKPIVTTSIEDNIISLNFKKD